MLNIHGLFSEGPRTALVYQFSRSPADLRDVMLNVPKLSGHDRRALSSIIATQVRSLHVHFQLHHTALWTESFVFFGDAEKPDLTKPYVLDRARPLSLNMYQHPEYQADRPAWFYQAWSLMMMLFEIADGQSLDGAVQDTAELLRKKMERKQLITTPKWKGAVTAEIFKYVFGLLEKDRQTLEQCSHWRIKGFYDKLCEPLAPFIL